MYSTCRLALNKTKKTRGRLPLCDVVDKIIKANSRQSRVAASHSGHALKTVVGK